MTNTLHIERTNTFNWNPQAPVARKPSKREEVQDDDNHCHSPGRPWVQSLPARRRKLKWLPHFFFFVFSTYLSWQKSWPVVDHHEPPFSAPSACWRRTSTGSPASPPSTRGSSLRSSHSQDHIVIYVHRKRPASMSCLAGDCVVRGRGQDLRGGDQGRLLHPPRHLLHWPGVCHDEAHDSRMLSVWSRGATGRSRWEQPPSTWRTSAVFHLAHQSSTWSLLFE